MRALWVFVSLALLASSLVGAQGPVPPGPNPPPPPPPGPNTPPSPSPSPTPSPSPGPSPTPTPLNFGFLSFLPGTWVGTGFNMIALPNFDSRPPSTGPSNFRVLLSTTTEILSFTTIGGAIPNRGSILTLNNLTSGGQPDINLFGLQYRQDVNQTNTVNGKPAGIHTEVGTWLNIPATTVQPVQGPTLVRMATIPHGDSLLAQSTFALAVAGGPQIGPVDSFPFVVSTVNGEEVETLITDLVYLAPYLTTVGLPPGITPNIVRNPNLLLSRAIANQTILETIVFGINTNQAEGGAGGVVNIPFVTRNANVAQLEATFWIETVQRADGTTFLQLQYTQTTYLDFLGIRWPHISIATLVKQNPPADTSPCSASHHSMTFGEYN